MTAGTRVNAGEVATELSREATYLSPSGRRCHWWPSVAEEARKNVAFFVYALADGRRASSALSEGFTLKRENWHLLRKVA